MQLKQNTFIGWAKEDIASLKLKIKEMKREVKYYYVRGTQVFERESPCDFFSLTNGTNEHSLSESELLYTSAKKHFYGTED